MVEEPGVGDGGRLRDDDAWACCGCCCGMGAVGMGMPSKVGTRWNGCICCWAKRCGGALVAVEVLIRLEVGGELDKLRSAGMFETLK